MQRLLETFIYNLRWILAPIYIGLSGAVFLLGLKFFHVLTVVIPHIFTTREVDVILITLALVDIALVGGLLVMVMLSGYENFVSPLHINAKTAQLAWLGKIDSG